VTDRYEPYLSLPPSVGGPNGPLQRAARQRGHTTVNAYLRVVVLDALESDLDDFDRTEALN
jgi:hypothetical protein